MTKLVPRTTLLALVSLSIGLIYATESVEATTAKHFATHTPAKTTQTNRRCATRSNNNRLIASKLTQVSSAPKAADVQPTRKALAQSVPAVVTAGTGSVTEQPAREMDSALQSLLRDISKALRDSEEAGKIENLAEKTALAASLTTLDKVIARTGNGNRIVPHEHKEGLTNTVSAESWESGNIALLDGGHASMNVLWARKVNGLINITIAGNSNIKTDDGTIKPIEFVVVVNGKSSLDNGFDIQSQSNVHFWLGKLTNFSIDAGVPGNPQASLGSGHILHALITPRSHRGAGGVATPTALQTVAPDNVKKPEGTGDLSGAAIAQPLTEASPALPPSKTGTISAVTPAVLTAPPAANNEVTAVKPPESPALKGSVAKDTVALPAVPAADATAVGLTAKSNSEEKPSAPVLEPTAPAAPASSTPAVTQSLPKVASTPSSAATPAIEQALTPEPATPSTSPAKASEQPSTEPATPATILAPAIRQSLSTEPPIPQPDPAKASEQSLSREPATPGSAPVPEIRQSLSTEPPTPSSIPAKGIEQSLSTEPAAPGPAPVPEIRQSLSTEPATPSSIPAKGIEQPSTAASAPVPAIEQSPATEPAAATPSAAKASLAPAQTNTDDAKPTAITESSTGQTSTALPPVLPPEATGSQPDNLPPYVPPNDGSKAVEPAASAPPKTTTSLSSEPLISALPPVESSSPTRTNKVAVNNTANPRKPSATARVVIPDRAVAGEQITVAVVSGKDQKPEPYVALSFNGSILTTGGDGRAIYQIPEESPPGPSLKIVLDGRPGSTPASVHIHQPLMKPTTPQMPHIDRVSGVATAGGIIDVEGHNFNGVAEMNHVILDSKQEAKILVSSPVHLKAALPANILPGHHTLTVTSHGMTSNAGQCETVAVQVQAMGKPEKASKWILKVVGTQTKVRVRLLNDSPDVVKLAKGNDQTLVTPGGSNNLVLLNAQRIGRGPIRLTTTVEPLQ